MLDSTKRAREKLEMFFCSPSAIASKPGIIPSLLVGKDLCCAKMPLITRKSINFTVNEVINMVDGVREYCEWELFYVNQRRAQVNALKILNGPRTPA